MKAPAGIPTAFDFDALAAELYKARAVAVILMERLESRCAEDHGAAWMIVDALEDAIGQVEVVTQRGLNALPPTAEERLQ